MKLFGEEEFKDMLRNSDCYSLVNGIKKYKKLIKKNKISHFEFTMTLTDLTSPHNFVFVRGVLDALHLTKQRQPKN